MNIKVKWLDIISSYWKLIVSFIIGSVLTCSVTFLYQWIKEKKSLSKLEEKVEEVEKKVSVTSFPLEKQTLMNIFSLQGHLLPAKEVVLIPESQLTVKKIYVKWGQKVKKGEPLFQVNSSAQIIKNQLDHIEQEIQESDFQAMSKLMQKEIISENEYRQKKLEFESQKLRRELQKVEGAAGDILSPIDGVISEVRLKEGDFIDRSDKYFVKIVDESYLRFQHYLPQDLVGKIKMGQKVDIVFDNQNGTLEKEEGNVEGISPIVDAHSGTVFISVTIPKNKYAWRPGIYVKTNFLLEKKDQVLALKNSSILYDKSLPYTYKIVKEDGKSYSKRVNLILGMTDGTYSEIKKSDINIHDQIVDQGISMVSDLSPLEIFHH